MMDQKLFYRSHGSHRVWIVRSKLILQHSTKTPLHPTSTDLWWPRGRRGALISLCPGFLYSGGRRVWFSSRVGTLGTSFQMARLPRSWSITAVGGDQRTSPRPFSQVRDPGKAVRGGTWKRPDEPTETWTAITRLLDILLPMCIKTEAFPHFVLLYICILLYRFV